jgi:hypothetical protein
MEKHWDSVNLIKSTRGPWGIVDYCKAYRALGRAVCSMAIFDAKTLVHLIETKVFLIIFYYTNLWLSCKPSI